MWSPGGATVPIRPKAKKPPGRSGLFQILMSVARPFAPSAAPGAGLPRKKPFALHALALQLAIAAHRFGPLAGALLGGLLIGAAQLHLPEDAFALHLLLQRLQRLVDIVVADDDLQSFGSGRNLRRG